MNILLNGATGRMGKEVIKKVAEEKDLNITCGVGIGENNEKFPIYENTKDIEEKVDVIIDFSIPKASLNILEYARKNKIPIVIATTGFSDEELKVIKEASEEIPVFRSSNMSLDINLMAKIVQEIARVLNDTDIEIIETHHNR